MVEVTPEDGARRISILCSGAALGVYVPALLLAQRLSRLGVDHEVLVLESLYTSESLDRLERHRRAYRENFALAQMAHRLRPKVLQGLNPTKLERLLGRWRDEERRDFVVWSGFWLDVLAEYAKLPGVNSLSADFCRIDARISASFRGAPTFHGSAREIWFWSEADQGLVHELAVDERAPLRFADREARLIVHGGGWGLGTYAERIPELRAQDLALDVIAYAAEPQLPEDRDLRRFGVDPSWRPWHPENERTPAFPPFGEIASSVGFQSLPHHHGLYDLIRRARAIVSKPGGGTLLDSLASATPLVYLEPYGDAEEANALLWEHLGFGISYAKWREKRFDPMLLEMLHHNLRERPRKSIDYSEDLARRFALQTRSAK